LAREHLHAWAACLARSAALPIEVKANGFPDGSATSTTSASSLMSLAGREGVGGSGVSPAAHSSVGGARGRWRVTVPAFQLLRDERKEYASYTLVAMRMGVEGGAGEEKVSVGRRWREVVAFHQTLSRAVMPEGQGPLPPLPETRYLNQLEPGYLEGKRKALEHYLQAVAALAHPGASVASDAEEDSSWRARLRSQLRVFLGAVSLCRLQPQ
jgi:hypothetical protein